jgi:hypothetical protein
LVRSFLSSRAFAGIALMLALFYVASSTWGVLNVGLDGLNFEPDGSIIGVDDDSSASRAGIVAGDRIVYASTPPATRAFLLGNGAVVGTHVIYAIEHRGHTRLVDLIQVKGGMDPVSFWKRPISAILCVLAGTLLLLRPQRATWAFFVYAVLETISLCTQYWSYPWNLVFACLYDASDAVAPLPLLYFAVSFVNAETRPWNSAVMKIAIAGTVAIVAATWLELAKNYDGQTLGDALAVATKYWVVAQTVATLVALVGAYRTGRRAHRQRIAWVVTGITCAVVFHSLLPQFVSTTVTANQTSTLNLVAYALFVISPLVTALALLYAMTQYRVVALRFAVSRTLVYGATTTMIVGIFIIVEWAAGRIFENSKLEAYAGLFTALLIGFAVDSLHKRVDSAIDVFFFRQERRAAERLRHLTASLQYADDEAVIAKFIVDEPARLLNLGSAALFITSQTGEFARVRSCGWSVDDLDAIAQTDELVPQLRAASAALPLQDLHWPAARLPHGAGEPLLALPLKARADLFAIVLYGGHTNGAALNADERFLLQSLASHAASAYDHVEAVRARAEMQRLRQKLESVRSLALPL